MISRTLKQASYNEIISGTGNEFRSREGLTPVQVPGAPVQVPAAPVDLVEVEQVRVAAGNDQEGARVRRDD